MPLSGVWNACFDGDLLNNNHIPKVSICIPAYKQIDFLRLTLESIHRQDFADYELVVTDDSPDDSVENLVREFDFGGKLRYYRNPVPLGSPENWNECIRKSSGELVKIMHHDDHFTGNDSLGQFVALLDGNPQCDFGFSAAQVLDQRTGQTRVHCPAQSDLDALRVRPHMLFAGNIVGAPSATIYRRKVGLEYDRQMKWLVDIDFYIRVLWTNPNFAFSPLPLIATPTNATHQVTEICRDNAKIELFEYSRLFSKLDSGARADRQVVKAWLKLFAKYWIWKISHFERWDVELPQDKEHFEQLFARQHGILGLLHQVALGLLYRLYALLPSSIRTPLRWVKNRILSLGHR